MTIKMTNNVAMAYAAKPQDAIKPQRRGRTGALLAMALVIGGAVFSTMAHAAPKKLTYATYFGSGEFYETSAKFFMDEVTKRSKGQIIFEPYYGGALLRPAEIGDGLGRGVADVALTVPAAFNPREVPLAGVVLPFVSENPYAVAKAFEDMYTVEPRFMEQFTKQNHKPLWTLASGENTLWTNKPVRNFDDLKGLRIRSIMGVAEVLNAAGATPVAIPWVEALELMQRGGVEGVSGTAFFQAASAGTLDMAKYASNGGRMGNFTALIWSMNLQSYDRLTPDERAVVDEVAKEVSADFFARYDAEVDRNLALVEKSAVEYIHMDDAEIEKLKKIAEPVAYASWAARVSKTKVDPKAFYGEFMTRVRNYETQYPYVPGFDRLQALKSKS